MRTQGNIIREYANGIADGFLNDLCIAVERGIGPSLDSENALIQVFVRYIADPTSLLPVAA